MPGKVLQVRALACSRHEAAGVLKEERKMLEEERDVGGGEQGVLYSFIELGPFSKGCENHGGWGGC